ncbi:metal-dependent transcriptional regulator [Halobaculum sp. P14]|uniref:metal-dependent transcriptional regulator n=1 Tax=Halobaculum sp. P14 TaxID=3421638 RepID=UPI003EBE520B
MAAAQSPFEGFCAATHPDHCVDRHPGRYLVAVYRLGVGADHSVTTGDVSDALGVQPASVTEMLNRLDSEGLVAYEKYRGARLTGRGETVARELAWRQWSVRVFFAERLDLTLDDRTAYRIGYTLPKQGLDRLTDLAGADGD